MVDAAAVAQSGDATTQGRLRVRQRLQRHRRVVIALPGDGLAVARHGEVHVAVDQARQQRVAPQVEARAFVAREPIPRPHRVDLAVFHQHGMARRQHHAPVEDGSVFVKHPIRSTRLIRMLY
jgi:hypothetical protein